MSGGGNPVSRSCEKGAAFVSRCFFEGYLCFCRFNGVFALVFFVLNFLFVSTFSFVVFFFFLLVVFFPLLVFFLLLFLLLLFLLPPLPLFSLPNSHQGQSDMEKKARVDLDSNALLAAATAAAVMVRARAVNPRRQWRLRMIRAMRVIPPMIPDSQRCSPIR